MADIIFKIWIVMLLIGATLTMVDELWDGGFGIIDDIKRNIKKFQKYRKRTKTPEERTPLVAVGQIGGGVRMTFDEWYGNSLDMYLEFHDLQPTSDDLKQFAKKAWDASRKESERRLKCCTNCKHCDGEGYCPETKSYVMDLRLGCMCGKWEPWENNETEENGA